MSKTKQAILHTPTWSRQRQTHSQSFISTWQFLIPYWILPAFICLSSSNRHSAENKPIKGHRQKATRWPDLVMSPFKSDLTHQAHTYTVLLPFGQKHFFITWTRKCCNRNSDVLQDIWIAKEFKWWTPLYWNPLLCNKCPIPCINCLWERGILYYSMVSNQQTENLPFLIHS